MCFEQLQLKWVSMQEGRKEALPWRKVVMPSLGFRALRFPHVTQPQPHPYYPSTLLCIDVSGGF
jgi:hypothetical protein